MKLSAEHRRPLASLADSSRGVVEALLIDVLSPVLLLPHL
jgi:hypothetical protein